MRTLYRDYSDDCCGYCKLHHVGITPQQLKIKKCTEKRCIHFSRYRNHWYWPLYEAKKKQIEEDKIQRKNLRKERKERQKAYLENLTKGHQDHA